MSGAPIWTTPAGSLGVIAEGRFYNIDLRAYDQDFPTDPTKVTYTLLAGSLPAGIQVDIHGSLQGIPFSTLLVNGVPAPVSQDVTSKFVIRATDASNRISDRTFSLTISGQDKPVFVTPAGLLGEWFDGTSVSLQIQTLDNDPGDVLTVSLSSGSLPPGLSINSAGLISGTINPLIDLSSSAISGLDTTNNLYDQYPWDFSNRSINMNYEFTLQVTDGKDIALRTFDMFVYSRNSMRADNTQVTCDNTNVTADSIAIRSPYILGYTSSLGTVDDSNYYTYKFNAYDPAGDQIQFFVDSGSLPPGLTLDSSTGWLYGYLPSVGYTEQTYTFGVRVRKVIDPTIESMLYTYTLNVMGNISTDVTWITDSFLGTINNGDVSTFSVVAEHSGQNLIYELLPGAYNHLPQGLEFTQNGDIIGRVSFKTFSLDGGTTTFDSTYGTRLAVAPTTFDLTYTFTVEVYTSDGSVRATKQFTILVNREYNRPYNIIYCKALPPQNNRDLINSIVLNRDVIPVDVLYRPDDPNFGSAKEVIYQHAYGLNPDTLDNYFAALSKNHYNKNLILGEIKTARALDDYGNVVYEVVYSQIIDREVNPEGKSVSPNLSLKYGAYDNGTKTYTVYPNSLENMREQVVNQIGQESKVLPRWMLSKQENGEVLGFVPAWVIAYTKPGKSKFVQYNIVNTFGTSLNLINFDIDRYTLNSRLSTNWDLTNQKWYAGAETTFDLTQTTADTTQVTADTTLYVIDGWVQENYPVGYVPRVVGPYDSPYETIFDGGSCRFISPVDGYDITDKLDHYVIFPKVDIVNNSL